MQIRHFAYGLLLLAGSFTTQAMAGGANDPDLLARGAYLAKAADCAACHTDGPKGKAYAGDYAIQSPLGTIYSTNITPSHSAGIGGWSEAQFARAVREGVAADGHRLYPAMPYDAYSGITDADIHALYAYFQQAVTPVDEPAGHHTALGFPYGMRGLMAGWDLLFVDQHRFDTVAGEVPAASRGKYLVDVLGHCGSCHTPRTLLMSSDSSAYLAGADIGGWHAPNITSDPLSGIGGWSEDELVGFLKNGHVAGKAVAAGGMAEAVEHSLRHLDDADLHAMAVYLKSVPAHPLDGQQRPSYSYGEDVAQPYDFEGKQALISANDADAARAKAPSEPSNRGAPAATTDGAVLFDAACASCHQPSGAGTVDHYYPSLYHNSSTGQASGHNLVMTILEGIKRQGADGATAMPAFKDDLDDAQVAAVAQYVAKRFGNPAIQLDAAKVAELRRGGPAPAIQRLLPWLLGGVVVIVLLLALLLVRRARRRA